MRPSRTHWETFGEIYVILGLIVGLLGGLGIFLTWVYYHNQSIDAVVTDLCEQRGLKFHELHAGRGSTRVCYDPKTGQIFLPQIP